MVNFINKNIIFNTIKNADYSAENIIYYNDYRYIKTKGFKYG